MKCEYCGNNLSLEDEKCPYCGKENKLAKKHNRDMEKFENDYASVKKEVLANSRRFNGFAVRITVIAVLIALIACTLVGLANSYDIKELREERKIHAHLNEHKSRINELMSSEDYLGVYYYFYVNGLAYSRNLRDYEIAYSASSQYKNLLDYIYYLYKDDPYYTREETIGSIAAVAERLNEIREPMSDYDRKNYYTDEQVVEYVNSLADHSMLLIKGYFGLSDEDMEKFKSLSRARKQLMLEEGWENVK